jgi:hypothetical protein
VAGGRGLQHPQNCLVKRNKVGATDFLSEGRTSGFFANVKARNLDRRIILPSWGTLKRVDLQDNQ